MAEKHKNKATVAKAQVMRDIAELVEEQHKAAEEENKGGKSPLPEHDTDIEEGGVDLQTASTQLK